MERNDPTPDLPRCEWTALRAIVAGSPALACAIDPAGIIREINEPSARVLLDTPPADAVGTDIRNYFSREMCAAGDARSRRLLRTGRSQREIAMLRGVYMETTVVPIHVPGEGDVVLIQTTPCDPARAALLRSAARETRDGMETVSYPVADLGPLSALTQRELILTRLLAEGRAIADIAQGLRASEARIAAEAQLVGHKLGWGDLRGVRTHAFASGLHLYEDGYFGLVVLAAAEPEA